MQRGSIKTIRVPVVYSVDKNFHLVIENWLNSNILSRNTSQQYSETLEYLLTLIMTKIILYGSPSKKIGWTICYNLYKAKNLIKNFHVYPSFRWEFMSQDLN
jgi:hypothetical protein